MAVVMRTGSMSAHAPRSEALVRRSLRGCSRPSWQQEHVSLQGIAQPSFAVAKPLKEALAPFAERSRCGFCRDLSAGIRHATHYFDRPPSAIFLNPALNGNTPLKWRLPAIKSVLYGISRQFHPRKSPAAKAVLKY